MAVGTWLGSDATTYIATTRPYSQLPFPSTEISNTDSIKLTLLAVVTL